MTVSTYFNILKRYLANRREGRPLYVSFELTDACNADCDFCYFRRTEDWDRTLKFDDSSLETLRTLNPVLVGLVGGEPLIIPNPELEKLIDALKNDLRIPLVQMTTNGSKLTLDRYVSLSDAGLDRINISLDYPGERHDEVRGIHGLHSRITGFLDEIKSAKIRGAKLGFTTVILDDNFHLLEDIVKLAQTYEIQVSFQAYSPVKNGNQEHALNGIFERGSLVSLKDRYPSVVINPRLLLQRAEEFIQHGSYGKCQAGQSFAWLKANGQLAACTDLPESTRDSWEEVRIFAETNDCNRCDVACRQNSETLYSLNSRTLLKILRELLRTI